MSLAPFDAARFKVLRAREHIKELDFEIHYLAAYSMRSDLDTTGLTGLDPLGRAALKKHWHNATVRPAMMALILGDAIHNLRSALDHMAVDVVRLNGGGTKGVYFPFAESRAKLAEQIKNKNFDRASPAAIAELYALQPYKNGNIALRGLHDLDVKDKHELILPAVHLRDPAFTTGEFPLGAWPDDLCPKCGAELRHPDKDKSPYVWLGKLTFGPIAPFAGEKVIPTLHGLAETVASCIETFAALLITP